VTARRASFRHGVAGPATDLLITKQQFQTRTTGYESVALSPSGNQILALKQRWPAAVFPARSDLAARARALLWPFGSLQPSRQGKCILARRLARQPPARDQIPLAQPLCPEHSSRSAALL